MRANVNNCADSGETIMALFESGNTRLHFALWDGSVLIGAKSVTYPHDENEIVKLVDELLGGKAVDCAAACSVSNRRRSTLFRALSGKFPGHFHVARTSGDIHVEVDYEEPETIGIDRVLAAHAAFVLYDSACVVVDAGTAVTVDAVSDEGELLGGYIFPGLDILCSCLSTFTDLPVVKPATSYAGIGHGTVSCLANAASTGFIAAIDELVGIANEVTGDNATVILTGGGAQMLNANLPFETFERPYLAMEGLGRVAEILPLYAYDKIK